MASRRLTKEIEMLFAHLKRFLRLDRLRQRGPCGARDEIPAAAAQNHRKLAKLKVPTWSGPAEASAGPLRRSASRHLIDVRTNVLIEIGAPPTLQLIRHARPQHD